MASDLFGAENIGEATPTSADTGAIPDTLLSTSVQVPIPTEGMQLAINGTTVDEALRVLKPRSSALWACSDRRTIQVATQAPGAVSSDVVSGVCQVVGSSIAKDGVDWTATLAIGPVTEASLLPVLVGSTIVLLLIAGLTGPRLDPPCAPSVRCPAIGSRPGTLSASMGAESPKEECGLFGVWAPGDDVARLTYFGLFAQQHRGQESAGIAVGRRSQHPGVQGPRAGQPGVQ